MRSRVKWIVVLLTGALAGPGLSAAAPGGESDDAATIEKLLPGMGASQIPDRKDAQLELEKLCHEAAAPGQESRRAGLARAMMARLGPETAKPARVWMLRKLETLGAEEVVEGLTAIMKESDPEIRDPARRALANNPSPKAAAALRTALAGERDPDLQVALINALAWRQDTESVGTFAKLAGGQEAAVARAAVSGLADISDPAAVKALADLRRSAPVGMRTVVVDASLRAADHLRTAGRAGEAAEIYNELMTGSEPETVRMAAITGLAAAKGADAVPKLIEFVNGEDEHLQLIAARCLQRMDKSATPGIVQAMQAARGSARGLLLEVIGERGDRSALKAVADEAASGEAEVRLAALGAISRLGDSSVLKLVIERGTQGQGAEREAARKAMAALHGKDVDGLIVERLEKASGAERVELLYAVWGRRIAAAKPMVFEAARRGDEPARAAALTALERIAKTQDLPALVDLLTKTKSEADGKLAEQAIASTCRRAGDNEESTKVLTAAMDQSPAAGKIALIRLLAQMQSEAALPVIRSAARSSEESVSQAAKAALKTWKPTHITTWAVSGPYRRPGKGPQELFGMPFAPEESPGSAEWKPLRLNKREAQAGVIDLKKLGAAENCCAYARVLIRSEREQKVILSFGSDDGLKVWLDGQVVHEKNATRALNCDGDQVQATLKAGDNALMVKVTQGGGDWSLCCKIGAVEGGPAEGVSFEAK